MRDKLVDGHVDRASIQPEDLKASLLPNLIILERFDDEDGQTADFVYRLMGGTLVDFAGINMTGKPLSSFPHPDVRISMEAYSRAVCGSVRPLFSATQAAFGFGDTVYTERSLYPARKGDTIGIIALITVSGPPAPYDTFQESPDYRHVREHFRILDGVGQWG